MATAGDGGATTASAYEGSGGGGGAGGKFRKRPFRRTSQTTPYDRPPTTLRNPSNSNRSNGGWLSKLVVDPASKLLSASAHYFFPSILHKRLPSPLSSLAPPEASQEQRDRLQVAVPIKCDGEDSAVVECVNQNNGSDGSGISKLEQILRQKTFTRSEIDRLTELLHSRTVDLPVEDGDRTGANLSKQVSEFERHQGFTNSLAKENKIASDRFNGIISTPVVSSRVLEDDVASPAELAKAYMGSRPSKVSPSVLGFRSQALREDGTMINKAPFPPKSAIMPLAPKIANRVGFPNSSFTTPRSRGRSAIYSMARTPYSKVHSVTNQKGTECTNNVSTGSRSLSTSKHAWEHEGQFVSEQVALKRRSSVIEEDEIGTSGSLRRVRQKPNLLSQGNPLSICGMEVGFDSRQRVMYSMQKPIFTNEPMKKVSKTVGENEDNNIPKTVHASVPSKSSEMAAKILQHLEKLTPKEKSSESKLLSAREKLPSSLTSDILRGRALKSLEDVDSSKLLQNGQDSHMLKDTHHALLPDVRDSTSEKLEKVEENGIRKFSVSPNVLIPVENGDITVISSSRSASAVTTDLVAQPLQKKCAFQISAPEDYLELDDDIHSNRPASKLAVEEKEKLETSIVGNEAVSTEVAKLDKPSPLAEIKKPEDLVLNKTTDFGTSKGSVVGGKNNGSTFSVSIFPDTTLRPTVLAPSTSENYKSDPAKEANAPLLFSFSSEGGDKDPQNEYSSLFPVNESSGLKPSALPKSHSKSSNSLASVQLMAPEPDKVENKNTEKAGGTIGILNTLITAGPTATLTSSTFSFGDVANNSNSCNGSLASSPTVMTVPCLASTNYANQMFSSSSHIASSASPSTAVTATTSMPSSSTLSASTVAPSLATAPIFKFGSSMPSNSISVAPTTFAEPTEIKSKTEKEGTSGNLSRSVFGSTSITTASTGSSIFGFGSSGAAATMNNQPQGSLFGTGNGLVCTEASPSGSGAATVSHSMPIQFGSSASSPVFGTSVITSSSTSLFASSSSAAKLFGSGSSCGLNSSASSPEMSSATPSSGATSSTFTFGASSSAHSSGTNSINSSTTAIPSIFNFGASSSASSSGPNFINSSTAATSTFAFGASSSSSALGSSSVNPSTAATPSVFTFGFSSSASSSGANSNSSASGPTSSVFGPSWQPNLSGSTFSSPSPSIGFLFGASSSSVANTSSAPILFGASTGISAGSIFSLASASASISTSTTSLPSQSQPIFGNTPVFAASSGNSDQMNMEDSMAEDPVQATTPAVPVFGQPASQTGFMFGSTAPSPANPFQFGGQQNQAASQNVSIFQASNSLEFNAAGSFSLGSGGGGGDKSNRKMVKVSRSRNRRK